MRALIVVLCLGLASPAWAAEKKSCEVLLTEATIQAQNVTSDRDGKERKLAEVMTQLYILQQQKQALDKELADLKKPNNEKKVD